MPKGSHSLERVDQTTPLIWIIPNIGELSIYPDKGENVCNAQKWKIFFHSLFYGRLYVWSGQGALVNAVHLGEFQRYVEESSYYDSYGSQITHGGYYKSLKRIKTVSQCPYREMDLAIDFKSIYRKAFTKGKWLTPECLVWLDRNPAWWIK